MTWYDEGFVGGGLIVRSGHDRDHDRLRPLLDRPAGPRRPASGTRALGVSPERIYTDHGLTGTNRARPGLDQALAAVRAGDTLVVPKLDRLARSVPDARTIADTLVARGVKLALGASVYDPADPMGKMFFNILATFAEFEADLIRLRTREGMAIARARGNTGNIRFLASGKAHERGLYEKEISNPDDLK